MRAVAAIAFLLSFAASTSAYLVNTPNAIFRWLGKGSQAITWSRVVTDPENFAIVLDNQSISGFHRVVLAKNVDGTTGHTTVDPPQGGWVTGENFRINFVKSENELDTILAQSGYFSID